MKINNSRNRIISIIISFMLCETAISTPAGAGIKKKGLVKRTSRKNTADISMP